MNHEQLKRVALRISEIQNVTDVILFGSNRNLSKPDSDVDILVVGPYGTIYGGIPPHEYTGAVHRAIIESELPIGTGAGQLHVTYITTSKFSEHFASFYGHTAEAFISRVQEEGLSLLHGNE